MAKAITLINNKELSIKIIVFNQILIILFHQVFTCFLLYKNSIFIILQKVQNFYKI